MCRQDAFEASLSKQTVRLASLKNSYSIDSTKTNKVEFLIFDNSVKPNRVGIRFSIIFKKDSLYTDYKPTQVLYNGVIVAALQIEKHYEDRFTYALFNWAMLSVDPEIVAMIKVYGNEGIAVAKERVDFKVVFKIKNSVWFYANYLNEKMNPIHDFKRYIVMFKDVIEKYNLDQNEFKILVLYFNPEVEIVDRLE